MARRASRLSLTGVEPIPVAEEAAVEAIPPILEVPTHEGYIRKSHAGGNFLKKNVRRWCVAKGFNIIYYNTKEKNGIVEKDLNTVKGHFDLRNVIKAEAVSERRRRRCSNQGLHPRAESPSRPAAKGDHNVVRAARRARKVARVPVLRDRPRGDRRRRPRHLYRRRPRGAPQRGVPQPEGRLGVPVHGLLVQEPGQPPRR